MKIRPGFYTDHTVEVSARNVMMMMIMMMMVVVVVVVCIHDTGVGRSVW